MMQLRKPAAKQYRCEVCNVTMTCEDNYKQHLESQRHKNKVSGDGGQFFCDLCNVTLSGMKAVVEHTKGRSHLRKLELSGSSDPMNGMRPGAAATHTSPPGDPVESLVAAPPLGSPTQAAETTQKSSFDVVAATSSNAAPAAANSNVPRFTPPTEIPAPKLSESASTRKKQLGAVRKRANASHPPAPAPNGQVSARKRRDATMLRQLADQYESGEINRLVVNVYNSLKLKPGFEMHFVESDGDDEDAPEDFDAPSGNRPQSAGHVPVDDEGEFGPSV